MIYPLTKYRNRRLYDRKLARYVTLEEVGQHWDRGMDLLVIGHIDRADVSVQTVLRLLKKRVDDGTLTLTQAQLRALVKS